MMSEAGSENARALGNCERYLQAKYHLSIPRVVQMQRERRWPLRWDCRANAASLAERQIRKPVMMHTTSLGVVL